MCRRPGQSRITTPRKETDTCKILSGTHDGMLPTRIEDKNSRTKNALAFLSSMIILMLFFSPGMTTGTPIHVFVPNTDQRGGVSI